MPTILSTKKLALHQKELLLNSGMALVTYDAININFFDFELDIQIVENAILTSKNALIALETRDLQIQNCFCVGEKTAALAREKGFDVLEIADSAISLSTKILEKYKEKDFHFFSGDIRRDELPELLKNNNIRFRESTVYSTAQNLRRFESQSSIFICPSSFR